MPYKIAKNIFKIYQEMKSSERFNLLKFYKFGMKLKKIKLYDSCPPDSQLMLHMMDYKNHSIAHVGTGPSL